MTSRTIVILFISSGFLYFANAISCIKCENVKSIFRLKEETNCSSQQCEQASDSCFVHIADKTVRRGCLKESIGPLFTNKEIDLISDCKDKYKCQLCSDRDDCNNIEITDETCIDCQTQTNLNCLYVPDEKMSKICPLSLEPRGCYLQKPGLANIKRGCMSELDVDERKFCLNKGSKCKTCIGNDCNLKIKFQSCHSCDSIVDGEKCVSSGRNTNTKLCTNFLANCFINVDNNTVKRGCLNEDMPEKECTSGKCKTCKRLADCNSENIVAEMCISCDSKTDPMCHMNATYSANKTCPLSAGLEGCYHHISVDGHHIRGCVSTLDGEQKHECQRDSINCKTCFGDNCNVKTAFSQCITCRSISDPNCIENYDKSSIKTCQTYDDECFVFVRKNSVKRGCLREMSPEFVSECQETYMQAKCQICKNDDGSACNIHDLTDTCIECDSSNNIRCRDDPASIIEKICSAKANKSAGCYLHQRGDAFKRGCVEDIIESYQNQCYKQSETCKSCFGRNCNTAKSYKTCYVCNSRDDSDCAKVTESTDALTCLNYLSSCVTGIENGYLYRNCTENVVSTEKTVENEFEICSNNKCNENVFPPQRLLCYQCNGKEECEHLSKISNITSLGPCKFYSELDQCYTLMKDDNTVHRGCISDLDTYRFSCDKEGALCKKCNQSGCNDGKIEINLDAVKIESSTEVKSSTLDTTNLPAIQNVTESSESSSTRLTGSFMIITLVLLKFF